MSKRKWWKDSKISPRKMINRLVISSRLLYDEYNLEEELNMKNGEEIKELAKWCLNCKVKPCQQKRLPDANGYTRIY